MSEYKLVPVEQLKNWHKRINTIAAEDAFNVADEMESMLAAQPAVQGEPAVFDEDAALSLAERTFSTEVGEQLASDIIQYAQRLHSLYTAPKPAEQQPAVAQLVEALEEGLRAIGDHHAPDDCYATGPMTGDPFRDLVQCPACSFIAMCGDALAAHRKGAES